MSAQEKTAGGLSRRNLWAYPVGTVGRDMAGCMFTNYLLTYVLFTKTLTSVQFACISVIMVAARVFDAFNDPIMGNVVEATRTRWGKFKPWIAIGGVLSVIVFITSFSTTLQGWAYVAAFGLLYFAYSVVFTMNDIAYWGMVPALARRADDRNRLTSRTVLFAGVGQFLGGIVVPTFTAGSLVIGGNAVTAYRAVVLIVCAAFTATQLITLLVVREPSARDEAPAEKVGIRKAFSTIARNDQLVWCAVVFLIFSVAQTLMGGGLSVTYLYFEFGYNGLLLSIFSILGNVAGAVSQGKICGAGCRPCGVPAHGARALLGKGVRIHRPLDAAARRGADSGCGPGGKAGIRRRIHKRKSSGEQAASACSPLLLL